MEEHLKGMLSKEDFARFPTLSFVAHIFALRVRKTVEAPRPVHLGLSKA